MNISYSYFLENCPNNAVYLVISKFSAHSYILFNLKKISKFVFSFCFPMFTNNFVYYKFLNLLIIHILHFFITLLNLFSKIDLKYKRHFIKTEIYFFYIMATLWNLKIYRRFFQNINRTFINILNKADNFIFLVSCLPKKFFYLPNKNEVK